MDMIQGLVIDGAIQLFGARVDVLLPLALQKGSRVLAHLDVEPDSPQSSVSMPDSKVEAKALSNEKLEIQDVGGCCFWNVRRIGLKRDWMIGGLGC